MDLEKETVKEILNLTDKAKAEESAKTEFQKRYYSPFGSSVQRGLEQPIMYPKQNLKLAKEQTTKPEVEPKKEDEIVISKPVPQKKKKRKNYKNVLETPNYDFIDEIKDVKDIRSDLKQKKFTYFRTRVFALSFALLGLIGIGWTTHSTISLLNANRHLAEITETVREASAIKTAFKVSQLDTYQNIEDGDENLYTSVITPNPLELENPTDLITEQNFFNRICSWLSSIFGG